MHCNGKKQSFTDIWRVLTTDWRYSKHFSDTLFGQLTWLTVFTHLQPEYTCQHRTEHDVLTDCRQDVLTVHTMYWLYTRCTDLTQNILTVHRINVLTAHTIHRLYTWCTDYTPDVPTIHGVLTVHTMCWIYTLCVDCTHNVPTIHDVLTVHAMCLLYTHYTDRQ